jgi:ATP-dependent Clp protease protease subunit
MNLNTKRIIAGLIVLAAVVTYPLISAGMAAKADGPQTILIDKGNLLVLNSEVNGDSVGPLIQKARELDAKLPKSTPLYLYLNTPGGSIQSGLELIEALHGLGRKVHTISAFSASMGFQIVENLNDRYILQSGILMSHRAAGEFAGSFGGANPSQLDQRVHLWVQITKEMDQNVVERSRGKLTLESYQKAYANELWMTGQESVSQGYADEIVKVKCDKNLNGVTSHSVQFFGISIMYDLSDCPINTAPMNVRIGNTANMSEEYVNKIKQQFLSGYEMKMKTPLPMVY